MIDFSDLSICVGLFYASESGNHVHCIFIFPFLLRVFFTHSYMISRIPNTNNLHKVVWFQVFISNTNILYTVIQFQITNNKNNLLKNNYSFKYLFLKQIIDNSITLPFRLIPLGKVLNPLIPLAMG